MAPVSEDSPALQNVEAAGAAAAVARAPVPAPAPTSAGVTRIAASTAANDAVYASQRSWLARALPIASTAAAFVGGMLYSPSLGGGLEEITATDGTVYSKHGDELMWNASGADGAQWQTANPQEDMEYRTWLANGGDGSIEEWRASGKPKDVLAGGVPVPNSKTIVSSEMEAKILYGQRKLNGQGNPSNRLIGAHSGQINNTNERFAVETLSVNADGTRNVRLITQFEDGNVSRIKSSTLFPENWSDVDVMSAVNSAGSTAPLATRASDGASLHQATVNGVKVEVIKVGDNVTAAYPCGRGCTDPSAFGG